MEPQQIESENLLPEWAFVEVMGHAKIVGRLNAVKLGMAVMLQVNVLKADDTGFAYSKMFSPASLFSITPVDKAYCLAYAKERERFDVSPVPYITPAKQLGNGESEDFFDWCNANGFSDVGTSKVSESSPERLKEALEAYEDRFDKDDLKKQYAHEDEEF